MKRTLLSLCLCVLCWSAAAEDFSFKDTQGRAQRLADYRGKWVLVNFWATWCPPCLQELPDLVALHNAHKDKDLVVIGIAMDYASAKVITDFVAKHAITYPVVLGTHTSAAQIGEVDGLPSSYLYNPSGKLVAHQSGIITRESVEEYISTSSKK